MKCPFKKITQTEITYKSGHISESPKPHKIERRESFGECDDMACRAYKASVCVKLGC